MGDPEQLAERLTVWDRAAELVAPIVEKHGLETYKVGSTVISYGTSTFTSVDQHIDHILRVANWLIGEEEK